MATSKERAELMKAKLQQKIANKNAYERNQIIMEENNYVNALGNGSFFVARANMLAMQINDFDNLVMADGIEKLDGKQKTKEILVAEFCRTKITANQQYRKAFFAKTELNKLGVTDEEIDEMFKDYTRGDVIRESYDAHYSGFKGHSAKFVQE